MWQFAPGGVDKIHHGKILAFTLSGGRKGGNFQGSLFIKHMEILIKIKKNAQKNANHCNDGSVSVFMLLHWSSIFPAPVLELNSNREIIPFGTGAVEKWEAGTQDPNGISSPSQRLIKRKSDHGRCKIQGVHRGERGWVYRHPGRWGGMAFRENIILFSSEKTIGKWQGHNQPLSKREK